MTYRGDTDPLKAKETALASELSSLRRRERDVARALDDARSELRRQRTLPVLEDVRIASPCSASWEEMTGDARVRFCGKCAKNVYNLSEMTRDEAEGLLAQNDGESARSADRSTPGAQMCVRLYKRQDGTVLTADCPVGVKRKRVRRVVAVAAGAFGAGAMATMAAAVTTMGKPVAYQGDVGMGAVVSPTPNATSTSTSTSTPTSTPTPTGRVLQGSPPVHRK